MSPAKRQIPKTKSVREQQYWDLYVKENLENANMIPWLSINKTGSNLTDIFTRPHSSLQSIGEVDATSTNATKDKHVNNLLAKGWEDHKASTSNPHSVTKSQVGLGSADNTSDVNKPVSTATNTAINTAVSTHESDASIHVANAPQAPLTTQLTTITHTAPGTPDFVIQDFLDVSLTVGWAFANKDEANSVLQVIANLQTRVAELETKLQTLGALL